MANADGFDPPEVLLYMGEGSIPWNVSQNVRRAEVHHSVKLIPDRLFRLCRQLESVLLHEGLLRIGRHAFDCCESLRSFHCPSTVMEIGAGAFQYCSNLATFDLPEGLESIKVSTFCMCTSLEQVRVPALVGHIDDSAFYGCTNLASVELHEGLRTICESAFDGCSSLGRLRVPLSVEEIGNFAFCDCSSLASVQMRDDLPNLGTDAFGGCPLENFRFVPLSERIEAISMDNQTKSMFDSRLREMTLALTRVVEVNVDEDEDNSDDEEDDDALWENCKKSLGRAHEFLTYLELKGAAPVLEVALWKAKIDREGEKGAQGELFKDEDGGQDLSDGGRERKRPKVMKNIGQDTRLSREDCRVKCGSDVVFTEVLKHFTYSSSLPPLNYSEEGNDD